MRTDRRKERFIWSEETENGLIGKMQFIPAGLYKIRVMLRAWRGAMKSLCSLLSLCLGHTQTLWRGLGLTDVNRWIGNSLQRALEVLIRILAYILLILETIICKQENKLIIAMF